MHKSPTPAATSGGGPATPAPGAARDAHEPARARPFTRRTSTGRTIAGHAAGPGTNAGRVATGRTALAGAVNGRTDDGRTGGRRTGDRRTGDGRTGTVRAGVRAAGVVAAVLPVLLLVAACSGGSPDADGTSHASPGAVSSLAGHAPLTVQQLTRALVTDADVPGWVVQQTSDDDGVQTTAPSQFDPDAMMGMADSNGQNVLQSDRPECQPLADVASARPRIHRMASVGATFAQETAATAAKGGAATGGPGGAAGPQVVNQMLIASHAPGDAQRVMAAIRTALRTCTAFNGEDGQGTRTPFSVTPGASPRIGDEAVAYLMTDTSDKKTGTARVTVVRTGDTVTSYLSTKAKGGAGPVPLAIARKQSAKLAALLAGRK